MGAGRVETVKDIVEGVGCKMVRDWVGGARRRARMGSMFVFVCACQGGKLRVERVLYMLFVDGVW